MNSFTIFSILFIGIVSAEHNLWKRRAYGTQTFDRLNSESSQYEIYNDTRESNSESTDYRCQFLSNPDYTWVCINQESCEKQDIDKGILSQPIFTCDIQHPRKICCPIRISNKDVGQQRLLQDSPTSSIGHLQQGSKFTGVNSQANVPYYSDISSNKQSEYTLESAISSRIDDSEIPPTFRVLSTKTKSFLNCANIRTDQYETIRWTCQEHCTDNQTYTYLGKPNIFCDRNEPLKKCCPEYRPTRKFSTTIRPNTIHHSSETTSNYAGVKYQSTGHQQPFPYSSSADKKQRDSMSNELLRELKKYRKFDRDLLSVLSKENPNKNIVVSPASIKSLLSLLVEGSEGDTANEIFKALQFVSFERQKSIDLLRKLYSLLHSSSSNITLKSENKIYKAFDIQINTEYKNTLKSYYSTNFEQLDFSDPSTASDEINDWVNTATHGLIPTLVEPTNIAKHTKLFLVNYIYLKANWDIEFDPRSVNPGCFYPTNKVCRRVFFMSNERTLNYTKSTELKTEVFEIPFKDPRYTLVFMLPDEEITVYNLLRNLDGKDLSLVFNKLEPTSVNVTIPRTTIDFSSNIVQILKQLNIKNVFEEGANLSKMVKNNIKFSVNDVIHKARIEINEEGTKAAGASGGGVQVLSLDMNTKIFANRPFLFFIRDTTTSIFLFEGIVFAPDTAEN